MLTASLRSKNKYWLMLLIGPAFSSTLLLLVMRQVSYRADVPHHLKNPVPQTSNFKPTMAFLSKFTLLLLLWQKMIYFESYINNQKK